MGPLSRHGVAGEGVSEWVTLSIWLRRASSAVGTRHPDAPGLSGRPAPQIPPAVLFPGRDHGVKPSDSPHVRCADLHSSLLPGPTGELLCHWGSACWEDFPFPLAFRVGLWCGGIWLWLVPVFRAEPANQACIPSS